MPHPPSESCATCATETGTKRYCAPARCYCGHSDCPAFDSWIDLKAVEFADTPVSAPKRGSTWDDREGATWIDKL